MRSRVLPFLFAAASTWLLAACGSIPAYVPDLARPDRARPLAIDGTHGPLDAQASHRVLARLQGRSPDTDVLGRHLAIEEAITGTPLTTGNRVTLLQDGPATYDAMFAAIAAARDHVDLETYILEDDEAGHRFAQVLAERQRAGVQVNILRDSVGTLKTPAAFWQPLRDAGVRIVEFNPVNPLKAGAGWDLNQRDHRKLLEVDGRVAILGGINISAVYSSSGGSHGSGGGSGGGGAGGNDAGRAGAVPAGGASAPGQPGDRQPGWRDTDIRVEGPAAADCERLFLAAWEAQKGPPLPARAAAAPASDAATGHDIVRIVGSGPDDSYSVMFSALLSAIGNAETSVHLTNAYFVPDPQLLAALQAAARRGVDVSLVLPGHTDSWLVLQAGHRHYDALLAAGVKIHERRGAVLHSKTAAIDGVWSTVGSTNLDWRSFLHNHELNAIVLGPTFGAQLEALFQRDLAASDAITLESWRQRPVKARASEVFAGAWEWWL